eukprot:1187827-Prorocentrum_minimum.AAC.9
MHTKSPTSLTSASPDANRHPVTPSGVNDCEGNSAKVREPRLSAMNQYPELGSYHMYRLSFE